MINLLSPGVLANPYPTYNAMREQFPVCEIHPGGIWVISRYDDVLVGLTNHKQYTSTRKTELFSPLWLPEACRTDFFLPTKEPPEYHRCRSAINKPFSTAMVRQLKPLMNKTAEGLLRKIIKRRNMEFLADFAYPYIGNIMGEITGLTGIQPLDETKLWIKAIEMSSNPNPDRQTITHLESIIRKQKLLFEQAIYSSREINNYGSGFLSKLLLAKINGIALTDTQIVNILELLMQAGFQTTVHLLAISIVQLIRNPNLRKNLMQSSIHIPAFVDEIVRLYSSAPIVVRHTVDTITLHDVTIPKDCVVLFLLAAANRDPRRFERPDEYDLARSDRKNAIAFGYGSHICLGINLARLEMEVALHHLLPFIDGMSCPEDDKLHWSKTIFFRGLEHLQIDFR